MNSLNSIKTLFVCFGAGALLAALPAEPAFAQSFFEKLFSWGSSNTAKPAASVARPVPSIGSFSRSSSTGSGYSSYSSTGYDDDRYDAANGAYRTMCVRTCDGYYFPISPRASSRQFSRDARQCQTQCGEGQLFYLPRGSEDIKSMTDLKGRVYGRLPMAFAYRKSLVNGCACKPMPWSAEETERHGRYALIETPDKAQQRNAETARALAAAEPTSAELPSSATVAAKLAEAIPPAPERNEVPPVQLMAMTIVPPPAGAGKEQPASADAKAEAKAEDTNALGHLLPATMHEAVAQDTALIERLPPKRPRRSAALRAQRSSSQASAQEGWWFGSKQKYAWPGDAPVRRR